MSPAAQALLGALGVGSFAPTITQDRRATQSGLDAVTLGTSAHGSPTCTFELAS